MALSAVIYKGNAPSFTVTLEDEDGPVDVSGATTIKAHIVSEDYRRTLIDAVTLTLPADFATDGANGQITVAFTTGNTDAARALDEGAKMMVSVDNLTYESDRGAVPIRQDRFS